MWPFNRQPNETRSSYTDTLVAAITANARGTTAAFPNATAALEACTGIVGRAFAAAEVTGAEVDAATMCLVGRSLIRRGEIVFRIDVRDGAIKLFPASSHTVSGDYDPDSWLYRLNLAGPDATTTLDPIPANSVLHFMYSRSPETPFRGAGPIQVAQLAGRLSAETVAALADEASGPRGSVLPLPGVDGADATIQALKSDIKTLRGAMAFVESTTDSYASGGVAPRRDWEPKRLGFDAPASLINLHAMATAEVMAACGVSPALFSAESAGTGSRESYRQLMASTLLPLGKLVSDELSAKLETTVEITWDELRAGDISGRARALSSLVTAGVPLTKAVRLAGLSSTVHSVSEIR